jgi:hypothetical protein
MNFIKKHYEKILLGVMLFGLIGVLIFMIFYIASDKQQMQTIAEGFINPHVKALTNLDTTVEDSAITRLKSDYNLDFDTTNKLLNPMEWQRALDGSLIRATATGVQAAVATNCTPLYLIISLNSVIINEVSTNYSIKVEKQAAARASQRTPMTHYAALNEKPNDAFSVVGVVGSPENPDELVLRLTDTQEDIRIGKDKPYRHVDGYMADILYPPEKKLFKGRRVGDKFSFGGVDYSVVDINQNEVVLMDESNQKKTSLPFNP